MVKPKITKKEDAYIIPCWGPDQVEKLIMGFHTGKSLSDVIQQVMNAVKSEGNRLGIEEISVFYNPNVHNPEQPNCLMSASVNKDKRDGWTGAMDPTPHILKDIGIYEFGGYPVVIAEKMFELSPEEMVPSSSDQVLATKYIDELVANGKKQAQYMIRIIEF